MRNPSVPDAHMIQSAAAVADTAGAGATAGPAVRLWSWPRIWAVSVGTCVMIGLLEATHGYVGFTLAGEPAGGFTMPAEPVTWVGLASRALPSWTWLGLIAPGAVWLARRFPLAPGLRRRHFALHLVAAGVFAALFVVGAASLRYSIFVHPVSETPYGTVVLRYYAIYYNLFFIYYWSIAGVYSILRYYRESQLREVEKMELETMATKARLDALRRQLHPHFLFNLLSAISSQVLEGDRRSAVHALSDLSHLLRVSFSRTDAFITLREELEFLDMYVDLHRLRLEDRVRIEYRIDPVAAGLAVPTFLLQPLVENAIEHGLARKPGGGTVLVEARARATRLDITVSNPVAPGTVPSSTPPGVGLANTRERIHRSYAGQATFEFSIGPDEAVARVVLPLRHGGERSVNGRQDSYADRR